MKIIIITNFLIVSYPCIHYPTLSYPPLSRKDLTHCLYFLHPCLLGTPQNTCISNWQPLPLHIQQHILCYEGKFALNVFLTCLTLMRQKFWRTVESLSVTDSTRMLTPELKFWISLVLKTSRQTDSNMSNVLASICLTKYTIARHAKP